MDAVTKRFRQYCAEHYMDGYDTFEECYTDQELEDFVQECGGTWLAVMERARVMVSVWEERRLEARMYLDD